MRMSKFGGGRNPSEWRALAVLVLCTRLRMSAEHDRDEGLSEHRIWTFAKGGDELTVQQWFEGATVVVTLTRSYGTGDEATRAYDFPTEDAADAFHQNLDASLLQFGWVFIGHLPNQRSHPDRRRRIRKSDRRRWWTDGGTFLE
jgi:hypothetical protein